MVRRTGRSKPPEDDYDDDDEYLDEDDSFSAPEERSRRRRVNEDTRRSRGFGNASDNMDVDDDDREDDEEEEERTRTRRTRTTRSSRSRDDDREEKRSTRTRRSRRDSDDEPRKQDRRAFHESNMKSYKEKVAEASLRFRRFDIKKEDEEYPFQFLQPEPFAHFFRHWISKRPYTCLGDVCALCEIGDRAKPVLMFNVYDFDDDQVKVWELSKDPAKKVEKAYDRLEKKGKKLNSPGVVFAVSKAKKSNNFVEYEVRQLTPDDLEDFGVQALSRDEYMEVKGDFYTDEVVYVHTVEELEDVADKAND